MTDINLIRVGNYKNRPVKVGAKTKVHQNLKSGKWVITQRINNKWMVCHHTDLVLLEGAIQFKTSARPKDKELSQREHDVHSFVEGNLLSYD